MKVCAVASCRKDSSKHPGLTFFGLPRDPCAKGEWLDVLKLKHAEGSQNIKVCEEHFKAKDFCSGRRQLKIHAVPVLNLGDGKTEPVNSDEEFMHCDSDNDDILQEVKKITAAEAMMDRKIKEEPEEKPPEEQEPETGRRPSRRAAREAAKKIYNTVRHYGVAPDAEDTEPVATSPSKVSASPRPNQRQRSNVARHTPRSYKDIKVPPPNIDLVMECHEELLSTVQAEALLQAQLQYNMVMKTLRSLKANNVRIICQSADEPVPAEDSGDENTETKDEPNSPTDDKPNNETIQADKKENGSVSSMEINDSMPLPSPGPSILS